MLGLIAPAVASVLLAVVTGGSLSRWSSVHVRWWSVAVVCLLLQVALFSPLLEEQPAIIVCGPWLYVFSLVGIVAVLLANARAERAASFPLLLAALGVTLNCLVIVANGGYMPRSGEAAASLGMAPIPPLPHERLVNVQPIDAETRLAWLGDSIAQPRWLPLANVVSIGDALLAGGLACWAFGVTAGSSNWPRLGGSRGVRRDALLAAPNAETPA
jgi:Family of unknown function (DUF5317)